MKEENKKLKERLEPAAPEGGAGVNDEAAFQAFLDEQPDNHFAREVFADWLEEQGDPRGPGYRALGRGEFECVREKDGWFYWCHLHPDNRGYLPTTWWHYVCGGPEMPKDFPSRRAIENAAALAFSRLPPDRQAALLAGALACS
jgi:uncharacterized protein (TIGR02996 family)